jgi:hypothetical protein
VSRRDGSNAVFFAEKPGQVLCHLRAPIVPKRGTHSYGQNPISIELNPYHIGVYALGFVSDKMKYWRINANKLY